MKLLKRILVWSGIGLLALILLCISVLGLFIGWMKWSGDRDWKRVQAELHAKGEKLTFAELLPPPPPDSENFYADPMWQELTDLVPGEPEPVFFNIPTWKPRLPANKLLLNQWKTPLIPAEIKRFHALTPDSSITPNSDRNAVLVNLAGEFKKSDNEERRRKIAQLNLDLIQPASSMLSRISELASRPSAYFPVRYQDGFAASLPHISYLINISRLLSWRSTAELELGNTAAAASDILTILRLSTVQDSEPLLISQLVQISNLGIGLSLINTGIEKHQWTESDLVNFQDILNRKNLYERLSTSLRGERAGFEIIAHSKGADLKMLGVNQSALLFFVRLDSEYCVGDYFIKLQHRLDILNSATHGINASTLPTKRDSLWFFPPNIQSALHTLERLALPSVDSAIRKNVEIQTQLSQTLIACALERYRLAHGSYPGALEQLIPVYLSSIPLEPTTGNPMHYRLLQNGNFLLWAPGWELKTLDGKPGQYYGEGDIVWNLPIAKGLRN